VRRLVCPPVGCLLCWFPIVGKPHILAVIRAIGPYINLRYLSCIIHVHLLVLFLSVFFCYIVPYRREKTNKCILCEATSQHVVKPCTPFFSQTAVFPLPSLNDTPVLISKFVSRSLGFLGSSQDAYVIIHMNVLYLSHMWSFTVAASCFPKIFADLSSLQLSHPLMLAIKPNTTN